MSSSIINDFIEELYSIKNTDELRSFITGILTQKELVEIATRLQIVKMLKAGIPQHTIADELQVGVATVTRGSKELKKGRFKHIKPYERKQ